MRRHSLKRELWQDLVRKIQNHRDSAEKMAKPKVLSPKRTLMQLSESYACHGPACKGKHEHCEYLVAKKKYAKMERSTFIRHSPRTIDIANKIRSV